MMTCVKMVIPPWRISERGAIEDSPPCAGAYRNEVPLKTARRAQYDAYTSRSRASTAWVISWVIAVQLGQLGNVPVFTLAVLAQRTRPKH